MAPEADVTALLTTDNTLSIRGGFSLNYIHLKYFQDWYISIYSGENYNALTAPISESNLSYGKITNNTEKIIGNQIIFTIEWHVTSSNLTTLRNANTNFKYFISFNPKSFGNTSSGSWTQNDSNVVDQELNYRQIKGVIKKNDTIQGNTGKASGLFKFINYVSNISNELEIRKNEDNDNDGITTINDKTELSNVNDYYNGWTIYFKYTTNEIFN